MDALGEVMVSLGGGVVSAVAGAYLGRRQGKRTAEEAHDQDIEQRLLDVEFEMTDIRATLRERGGQR